MMHIKESCGGKCASRDTETPKIQVREIQEISNREYSLSVKQA